MDGREAPPKRTFPKEISKSRPASNNGTSASNNGTSASNNGRGGYRPRPPLGGPEGVPAHPTTDGPERPKPRGAPQKGGRGRGFTSPPTTVPPAGYKTIIRFFGAREQDRFWSFSNFALLAVTIDGVDYSTTEHYFQTMKFLSTSPAYAEQVRNTPTPYECKRLSKSRSHPIDPKWDQNRITVMRRALFAKALQHPFFAEELLSTGDAYIIEASPYDSYWGEGGNRKGLNMLGQLLMELRTRLRPVASNILDASNILSTTPPPPSETKAVPKASVPKATKAVSKPPPTTKSAKSAPPQKTKKPKPVIALDLDSSSDESKSSDSSSNSSSEEPSKTTDDEHDSD